MKYEVTRFLICLLFIQCTPIHENAVHKSEVKAALAPPSDFLEQRKSQFKEVKDPSFLKTTEIISLYDKAQNGQIVCTIPQGKIIGYNNEALTYKSRLPHADELHNPFIAKLCGEVKSGWLRSKNSLVIIKDSSLHERSREKGWDKIDTLDYL